MTASTGFSPVSSSQVPLLIEARRKNSFPLGGLGISLIEKVKLLMVAADGSSVQVSVSGPNLMVFSASSLQSLLVNTFISPERLGASAKQS